MSFAVNLLLTVVSAGLSLECAAQGDWISEIEEIKEKVIDESWREYVDTLGGEYEEVPKDTITNDEDDDIYLSEFLDWHPTSPREVPFLAVLFVNDTGPSNQYKEFFKGEPDPGLSHIEPHKACGGALLSPSHVLTVCGCLSNVISNVYGIVPPFFTYDDETPQFRLLGQVGGNKPATVYVHFSLVRFVPDWKHQVDTNKNKWITDIDMNCNLLIKTDASTPDANVKTRRGDANLIVVPIKPAITEKVNIYPKWPPHPIYEDTDPKYEAYIRIASIGMRLTERTKVKFYSSISVSSLNMKHCNFTSAVCDKKIYPTYKKQPYLQLGKTQTCFCSVTQDRTPQLVGGVIGWPVVDKNGDLIGITATERQSSDGTIVVTMITPRKQQVIEEYIGLAVLKEQSAMAHAYREKELKDNLLLYDYWEAQHMTSRPKAGATNLRITFSHSFLAFLLPNFV